MSKTNKVTTALSHLLADTVVLSIKARNFHWNVQGKHFYSYHQLFEEEYKALADAADEIAERIRALKVDAPGSLAAFLQLTSLKEVDAMLSADAMIAAFLHDHEVISKSLLTFIKIAQDENDEVSMDLFIERKAAHDKSGWMLRSILS